MGGLAQPGLERPEEFNPVLIEFLLPVESGVFLIVLSNRSKTLYHDDPF
jgi:hypothetical protein